MVKPDATVMFTSDSDLFGSEPSLRFVAGSRQPVSTEHLKLYETEEDMLTC